jgi:Gnt-I system high-affinity gluconate transporter
MRGQYRAICISHPRKQPLMTLTITILCILSLVLLISWGRLNAFLAFLLVALATGVALGIPLEDVTKSVQKGLGDTLGSLVVVIVLGAMIGKMVAVSGAAQRISSTLIRRFGERNIHWALMLTGFIVGIPLFYNVGFVLLVPLIFSIVRQLGKPAVWLGVPMLAALSVTHGFLPPHPSPTALVGQFGADMGLTLLYGFMVSVPAIILAGPVFARTLRNLKSETPQAFQSEALPDHGLPGTATSFFASLLPVALLAVTTLIPVFHTPTGSLSSILKFLSEPSVVMMVSLAYATWALGLRKGMRMDAIMSNYADAVRDVSVILLIVAGAGALKQVFSDSGVSSQIAALMNGAPLPPLVLGWMIAAVIRVSMGSATVAGLTTAGIIAPVIPATGADPNLMVLSIGAGSLMFSHVNDSGFWMFKEYFNLSVKDTIRSWSLMETIVAVTGLIAVLILNAFIH